MEALWLMGGFFILVVLVFLAITFLFPEWVGITGKSAREIMAHQRGNSPDDPLSESQKREDQAP